MDVEQWGYADARLPPFGDMLPRHLQLWTDAIDAQRSRVRERRRRGTPAKRRMTA